MAKLKVNPRTRKFLYQYFNYKCVYCETRRCKSLDHIIPRAKGGRDGLTNLIPSCYECNNQKGDILPPEHVIEILKKKAKEAKKFAVDQQNKLQMEIDRVKKKQYGHAKEYQSKDLRPLLKENIKIEKNFENDILRVDKFETRVYTV